MPTPTQEALRFIDWQRVLTAEIARVFLIPRELLLPRRPRFRKAREVHAQRARTLRRRGEGVWFVRWSANGKCIYAWGGPRPQTFTVRLRRKASATPQLTHITYATRYVPVLSESV